MAATLSAKRAVIESNSVRPPLCFTCYCIPNGTDALLNQHGEGRHSQGGNKVSRARALPPACPASVAAAAEESGADKTGRTEEDNGKEEKERKRQLPTNILGTAVCHRVAA